MRDIGFHLTINTNQRIYGKKLLCNIMWMHNLFVEQNVKITPTFSTPSSISVRLTSCLAHPLPPPPLPHVNVDYCFCQRAVGRIFSMHFHDLLWLPLGPIFASFPQQLHQTEEPPTPNVHFIFIPWEFNSSLNIYNYTMTLSENNVDFPYFIIFPQLTSCTHLFFLSRFHSALQSTY